jgi:hypothetical protein
MGDFDGNCFLMTHRKSYRKNCAKFGMLLLLLCYVTFLIVYNCKYILVKIHLLTLHLWKKHLSVLFLITALKVKDVIQPFWIIIVLCTATRSVRDCSTFTVRLNFKVSPLVKCVPAANAVFKTIYVFNKDCVLLTDTSQMSESKYLSYIYVCVYIYILLFLVIIYCAYVLVLFL